jgi:hypothetical protein
MLATPNLRNEGCAENIGSGSAGRSVRDGVRAVRE